MTRRFIDDIKADLNAFMVTGGETTADELRPILIDMMDSTTQDECVIYGTVGIDDLPTTPTYSPINVGYTETVGGDGSFLLPDAITGVITTSNIAGFTYSLRGQITVIAGNGDAFEFVILRNGTDVMGASSGLTGDGNNDPVGVSFEGLTLSGLANAEYTIGVRSPDGNETIDVLSIGLSCTIQPTDNP